MNQLKGKVLITGGSGSLGMAILDRAMKENWPAQFTIMARGETKISVARQRFPDVRCELGDVRDIARLTSLFRGQDTVIHAAALKIVPEAEASPSEAVRTNVDGSLCVAQAAIDANVQKVIGISTDKSCSPVNSYGATKFLMESLFKEADRKSSTQFVLARYGNVLGSANSILPRLSQLKAEGKPFTVTDARCTRFWLTMDDAIDLILLAYAETSRAATIVPKAPASEIITLFKVVDPAWPIVDIGIRPGEKIHEQLINSTESKHTIEHDSYFVVHPAGSISTSNLPDGYGYSSNNPNKTLTETDLAEMLGKIQ